jgi:hypothetical protein
MMVGYIQQLKISVIVILCILFVTLISKCTDKNSGFKVSTSTHVNDLIKQSSRWHTTSKQDTNPVIALMHANYAISYAKMARKLVGEKRVEKLTGVNISELLYFLEEDQQSAIKSIVDTSPEFYMEGMYAVSSGWV